mmetsp:Transcript_12623/g.35800  ORF Transcript_12623/g.35800 Transcript_12623/m.35800 type:complete len:153 (-) Transcript_12623:818-1276(-)
MQCSFDIQSENPRIHFNEPIRFRLLREGNTDFFSPSGRKQFAVFGKLLLLLFVPVDHDCICTKYIFFGERIYLSVKLFKKLERPVSVIDQKECLMVESLCSTVFLGEDSMHPYKFSRISSTSRCDSGLLRGCIPPRIPCPIQRWPKLVRRQT